MRFLICAFTALAAVSTAKATFVPNGAKCQDYTIPLTVTAQKRPWQGLTWTDNYGWINHVSNVTTRSAAGYPPPLGAAVNVTASYQVSATFCTPETAGNHSKTVLLATHGLGFDRG